MKHKNLFDSTIKFFEDYRSKMIKEKPNSYNSNLSNEVHNRLRQLSFICGKVDHYEHILVNPEVKLSTSTIMEKIIENGKLFDEGIVYAEAFYFFAWRIIQITDHNTNPLPGLKGLKKKAKGVTIVRNCLIEHPEKTKEKIFMISYGWGKDGPTLKNARPAGQTFEIQDRGLWINAQEFRDSLEELLQKAIQ